MTFLELSEGSTQRKTARLEEAVHAETGTAVHLTVRPQTVIRILWVILLGLLALTLLPHLASTVGLHFDPRLVRIFAFGKEANIPTLFSTAVLGLAAFLLFSIGRESERRDESASAIRRWHGLAVIFTFLAIDETAMIHEMLNGHPLGVQGVLGIVDNVSWVWFYGAGTILIAIIYFPFLHRLPGTTALGFILAGTIYVGGSIGFEILNASLRLAGPLRPGPEAIFLLEVLQELCEMGGSLLFVTCLFRYFLRWQRPGKPSAP